MSLPPVFQASQVTQLYRIITNPIAFLEESARRHGDAFVWQLAGTGAVVHFAHPEAIREIFAGDPQDFFAAEPNDLAAPLLGDASLLLMDGPRHTRLRKLMMPPFHGERLRAYGDAMLAATDREIDSWPTGAPFALHPRLQALSLEIIQRTVFGGDEGAPFETRFKELLVQYIGLSGKPLLNALLQALHGKPIRALLSRGIDPVTVLPGVRVGLGWLPWVRFARTTREIYALLTAEISRRRREGSAGREDILTLLIEARDEDGNGLSEPELCDQMRTLLFAGHETTATTLTWVMHRVLGRPDVLARIRAELAEVFGGGPVQPRDVGKLAYLDATLKETMRMHPILPMVGRKLQRAVRIGGYDLPEGTTVFPSIYLAHRRPDVWEEPEAFKPERFLGRQPTPFEYLPFGGGARRCLGMAFAQFEMKVLLARILSRASLRAVPIPEPRLSWRGLTLGPSAQVKVVRDA